MIKGRPRLKSCYLRYCKNVLCSLRSLTLGLLLQGISVSPLAGWFVGLFVCSTNNYQTTHLTDLSLRGCHPNGMSVRNDMFYVDGVKKKKNLNVNNPLLPFVTLLLGALSHNSAPQANCKLPVLTPLSPFPTRPSHNVQLTSALWPRYEACQLTHQFLSKVRQGSFV